MNKFSRQKVVHYADDSAANDDGTDLSLLTDKINFEIHKVDERLRANKLYLNITKSFFSVSSIIKNYYIPNFSIGVQILHVFFQSNFLGT